MKIKTHYDNLKVERDASPEDIKRAFRKLTFQHHPDRHPPEQKPLQERRMRLIKEAYDTLSNPITRAAHDKWIKFEEEKVPGWRERNFSHERAREEARQYEDYRRTIFIMELEGEVSRWKGVADKLNKRIIKLTTDINTLSKLYKKLDEKHKETQIKSDRKTMAIIGLIFVLGSFSIYKQFFSTTLENGAAIIISDNVKNRASMPGSDWRVQDWAGGRITLSRNGTSEKMEYIGIISQGEAKKEVVLKELRGSFMGRTECNEINYKEGIMVNYRFVQLQTDKILNVTVPLFYLCGK